MHPTTRAAIAGILLSLFASAKANVFVFNEQVDANVVAANGYSTPNWAAPNFDVAVGDKVQLNFNFLPGQALQIDNPSGLWGIVSANNDGSTGVNTTFMASMWFRGLIGSAHDVAPLLSGTGGFGLVSVFKGPDFMSVPGATISFTGLSFDYVVTGYSGSVTSRPNNLSYFWAFGDKLSVVAAAVPEPSTVSLTIAGLIAVGALARRRKTYG